RDLSRAVLRNQVPLAISKELVLDDTADTAQGIKRTSRSCAVGQKTILDRHQAASLSNSELCILACARRNNNAEAARENHPVAVCINTLADLAHCNAESRAGEGRVSGNCITSDDVGACLKLR